MGNYPLLIIPTFNNPTYLRNMLEQLKTLMWENYLIIDSGSTYPPMQEELNALPEDKKIILRGNLGPRYFSENNTFYQTLPEIFCVSDPDIEFNPKLPSNFVEILIAVSEKLKSGKVGFALDISFSVPIKENKYILESKIQTIREYESKYWKKPVGNQFNLEIFDAPIDTTFAIYNKRYFKPEKSFTKAIRIGGDFSAIHLPWLERELLPRDEIQFYSSLNKSGAFHEIDGLHERLVQEIDDLKSSISWKITKPIRGIERILRKL